MAATETTPDLAKIGSAKGEAENTQENAQGLATPEATPGPDEARNRADEQRRQAEITEPPGQINKPSGQPSHGSGKSSSRSKGSNIKSTTRGIQKGKAALTKNAFRQKKLSAAKSATVDKVLACKPTEYFEILGLKPGASKEQVLKAYRKRARITNPKFNKNKGASNAHTLVVKAAQECGLDEGGLVINDEDPEEMDVDDDTGAMEGIETMTRQDFLQNIYETSRPYLERIVDDPEDIDARTELNELNDQIKSWDEEEEANVSDGDKAKALIDIDTLIKMRQEDKSLAAKCLEAPEDNVAQQNLDTFQKSWRAFNQLHGYPESWYPGPEKEPQTKQKPKTKQTSKEVRPGYTREGEKILACNPMRMGTQFFVETEVNGKKLCVVKTGEELGGKASKAYMEDYPEKVEVGKDARKYRKADQSRCGPIIHVACKPVRSRKIGINSKGPKRPVAWELRNFDDKPTWMTFSDSVNMNGKTDAVIDEEVYYDERGVDVYPWDEEPEEVMKVIKSKKQKKKNKTRKDDQDDEDEEEEDVEEDNEEEGAQESGWTPINKKKASKSSSTKSSTVDEVRQLKEKNSKLETKMDEMAAMLKELLAQRSK